MKTIFASKIFVIIILLYLIISCEKIQSQILYNPNKLSESLFKKPDRYFYPETWFHFIGGNISKEGITEDLEAISAAGISGIQLFHGESGGEWPGVSSQVKALGESWDELIRWTADECTRLNLSFSMQNCPGWSYAGGPWIEPENSMRHLVYSRTDIVGGLNLTTALEKPHLSVEEWRNYKDLFVIAFPTPHEDSGKRLIPQTIQSNRNLPWEECLIEQKKISLSPSGAENIVLDVSFDKDTVIRTVQFPSVKSFSHPWSYNPGISVTIYAIPADQAMKKIASLEIPSANWQDDQPITIACEEVKAKKYRLEISNLHEMTLSFINFFTGARQQNWESEAGWTLRSIVREDFPNQTESSWIKRSGIIDITANMNYPSGKLLWTPPKGNWTVLRIGHVNTGMKNSPAPPEATGWECNKLDVSGVRANFDGYIGRLLNKDKVLENGSLHGILLDSWECKTQTWTRNLDRIFQEKWNYSLLSMFPALFGYVVDDPETTSLFLRDWRVTLNGLLVNNFFGEIKNIAAQNNLKVSFETASGDVFPGDILEYYKHADIPMCEFWHPKSDSHVGSIQYKPIKPTVSAARMYGKQRIAAESFTSFNLTWNEHPRFLKEIIDFNFAEGITHPIFHTYTHNPKIDFLPPGTSFGTSIGTPFLRLQTWWKHMPYFTDYLARCNYMLEIGRPISDVLMYLGDEQNHKPSQSLRLPEGYSYDYCNPDVLLNRLTVKKGHIFTPEGISYRVLWLYDCKRMLPETLEKIYSFAKQGVIVVGPPPKNIATLSGGINAKKRFKKAVKKLWGDGTENMTIIGNGKVFNTLNIDSVLAKEGIKPDILFNLSNTSKLRWLHRQTNESDIYFLSASQDSGYKGVVSFRSKGYVEIWDPLSGKTEAMKFRESYDYTDVELDVPAGNSCFIIFRNKKSKIPYKLMRPKDKIQLNDLSWQILFPKEWGVEDTSLVSHELVAWKDLPISDEGKSFSGTVLYETTFSLDRKNMNVNYFLDLGRVEVIAKVGINGNNVGTCWSSPYVFEVTNYLKEGENKLQIAVTSTWFNRLVYDAGLPEKERKTWTISGPQAGVPLKEYGLIGPLFIYF